MVNIKEDNLSRRAFVSAISTASIALMSSRSMLESLTSSSDDASKPFTILFQGDSITDGARGRTADPNHIMGHGYAFSIASELGAEYPNRGLNFINKGVTANTVADLAARWDEDTLEQHPDVLSILIGVNNVYLRVKDNITTPDNFEVEYKSLLDRTLAKYPKVLFVLCEPFILPLGYVNENLARWKEEIGLEQQIVKKIAKEYNAVFVGFQDVFTNACKRAPQEYWIWDGVHPTVAGHELMAREWIKVVSKILPIITSRYSSKD